MDNKQNNLIIIVNSTKLLPLTFNYFMEKHLFILFGIRVPKMLITCISLVLQKPLLLWIRDTVYRMQQN